MRVGRHPPNDDIARHVSASPELRIIQRDESAPSCQPPAFCDPSLFPSPVRSSLLALLVARARRLVRLLPRVQTSPSVNRTPGDHRGQVANPTEDVPVVGAGSRTDGDGSNPSDPPSVPTRRKRDPTRRAKRPLPEPTPATWIMVAPNRYIRAEDSAAVPVASVPPVEGDQGTPTSSRDLPLEVHDEARSNDETGVGLADGEGESITPPCTDLDAPALELDG